MRNERSIIGRVFMLLGMSFFAFPVFVLAEEDAIGDKPPITECEQEMLKAFDTIDYGFQKNYQEFLELPDITAVGKSTTGNIESYLNTYQCHLSLLCPSLTNALYQHPDQKVSFLLKECAMDGKSEFTGKEISTFLKADFSKCTKITDTQTASRIALSCQNTAALKYKFNENHAEKEFIKTTQLENNSFLSLKLLDMNKKLDVLLEKVQTLVVHFKKVNDDISCINPDSTGAR